MGGTWASGAWWLELIVPATGRLGSSFSLSKNNCYGLKLMFLNALRKVSHGNMGGNALENALWSGRKTHSVTVAGKEAVCTGHARPHCPTASWFPCVLNNHLLRRTTCLHFTFGRDLKKAELHLSAERAKVDSRLQNMDFLRAKAAEFRFGIKAAEVCMKNCV